MNTQPSTHRDLNQKLSIDDIVIELEQLHQANQLTLDKVKLLLVSLVFDDTFKTRVFSTKQETYCPTHRCVFWKSCDDASLEGFGWLPQTKTHIHSHDHQGLAKHLDGQLTAINFEPENGNHLKCVEKVSLEINQTIEINPGQNCIHSIANLSDTTAVDIHFYLPKIKTITPMRYDPLNSSPDKMIINVGDIIPVKAYPDPVQL